MGAYGGTRRDTEKPFWGLIKDGESLETRYPSSDPKESRFSIFFSGRIHPSWGSPPQPLLAGWLLEAKATALPGQLLLQPTWPETPQILTEMGFRL